MKNQKNIFFLTIALLGIIFIWLIPKTNGEKKTKYVRVYTEEREVPIEEKDSIRLDPQDKKTEIKKTKKERVVVQRDTLDGKIRMKDMKMSLYSRSRHFEPIIEDFKDSTTAKSDTLL